MAFSGCRFAFVFFFLAMASATDVTFESSEQAAETSLFRSWERDLDADGRKTPIQRVVELLKEMKAQLEKETRDDEELYDQMVCWCETNDKESTKAIEDATAKITDLTAEIAERAGRGAELQAQLEQLNKEIAESKEALAKATAMREKEYAEFTSEEKEMMQAVTNLKNAIVILGKHNAGLLQASPALVTSMGAVLRESAARRDLILAEHGKDPAPGSGSSTLNTMFLSLEADGKKKGAATAKTSSEFDFLSTLRSALNQEERPDEEKHVDGLPTKIAGQVLAQFAKGSGAFLQAGKVPGYAPQSGVIFGILNQMKEEFESEMSESQKAELQAQADYAELKKTKEVQIAAGEKAMDEKSAEMADNGKKLADAKEDLELTNASLNEDQKFLINLKLTCQALDKEWAVRSKTRLEEIQAVGETLAILTEDDARDLMAKTVTFLQMASTKKDSKLSSTASMQMRRSQALQVLKAAAKSLQPEGDDDFDMASIWHASQNSPSAQLSTMAVQVQLDAFTKVKAAIDDMVAELKAQQEEEVKHKDFCNGEFNDNEKVTFEKTKLKEDQGGKIEDLTTAIENLTNEIADAKAQVGALQVEIKKAGEQREKENAEFQQTVADQRATQAILNKAKARMEKFYGKKALMQLGRDSDAGAQEPPVKFGKLKKNAGGGGVMSFLNMIIEDSKAVEKEALDAEQEAQRAYETFVNDSNDTINQLSDSITAKSEAKAQADVDKETTTTELKNTNGVLEGLVAEKADLHEQCDFVLKNFDVRQQARLQEMEALQQAKAILSGSMAGGGA